VLQFKIVTPDGQYRTVNQCQNQDLFFALRGGGGGTFGVVLETSHVASPRVTVQAVLGLYEGTHANHVTLVKALAKSAVQFATDGWGGYIIPPASSAIWANPILDADDAKKSAAAVVKAFESVGGNVTFFTLDSYSDFFDKFIAPNSLNVGRPQVSTSRLLPSDKFTDDILIESMINGMLASDFSHILAVTPFAFKNFDKNGTSINPAWRNAVWHSSLAFHWNFNSTLQKRVADYQKLTNLWATVRARTPGAGVYFNEADVYEPDYINAFWGPNYPKLLAIKKKYDPDHILDCWQCVGWKGASDDRYKCYLSFDKLRGGTH
jgi:FAD/FMN-containing dehydrogenase